MNRCDLRFDSFIDELILKPEELALARQAAVGIAGLLRGALRPELAPLEERGDYLVVGSVGKRVAIRPLSAVDLLYLLPEDGSQRDGLWRMESALRAALPSAPVSLENSRLLVEVGSVLVAVRPAVEQQGAFAIPGPQGWMMTNPAAEMAALRLSDSLNDGRTTRFLALLKAWRDACAVPLGSFALELLVREFMAASKAQSWSGRLADFLAWGRRHAPRQLDLPGGLGRLSLDDAWHALAEAGYWRCVLAGRHAASGDSDAEIAEWRHLLGANFAAPPVFNMWNIRQDTGDNKEG
ncbi:MAG TPA: hypothetical protein HPP80_05075 [Rhodospirillaceae bacterium]|nr:hypothetical protein [Rhodospirillaceae bacterium]